MYNQLTVSVKSPCSPHAVASANVLETVADEFPLIAVEENVPFDETVVKACASRVGVIRTDELVAMVDAGAACTVELTIAEALAPTATVAFTLLDNTNEVVLYVGCEPAPISVAEAAAVGIPPETPK